MYATEGPLEYARTHLETGSVSSRPAAIVAMSQRLRAWHVSPEFCRCGQPARTLLNAMPFCAACRVEQRQIDEAAKPWHGTPKARATRHETVPRLVGHALVFDVRSQDLGGFVEIVRPEAVQRTLQEGIDLRALWNHNTDIVLGRVSAGTLRATRDGTGLAVDIWPGPEQRAFVASVSERGVTQMSFGFRTLDDAWHLEDELPIRELLDVRISEVSPVTFPAYLQTDLRVESGPRAWKPSLAFRERQIQAGAR